MIKNLDYFAGTLAPLHDVFSLGVTSFLLLDIITYEDLNKRDKNYNKIIFNKEYIKNDN